MTIIQERQEDFVGYNFESEKMTDADSVDLMVSILLI